MRRQIELTLNNQHGEKVQLKGGREFASILTFKGSTENDSVIVSFKKCLIR